MTCHFLILIIILIKLLAMLIFSIHHLMTKIKMKQKLMVEDQNGN
jgi:predicted Holliday junction resolvase-like endonuclease